VKKQKSRVRVVYHTPKIEHPKPNCPTCGKGFMRERVEVDPIAETRIRYMVCDVCGAGFDELGESWPPRKK
jgi:transcription elongation factor Elf1